jgi:uncharacterized protein
MLKKIKEKRKKRTLDLNKNILGIIWNILNDPDFIKLKNYRHHIFFNRYEHLINTSVLSYKIAKFLKADIHVCTLAWLLHDFHFTDIKSYKHWLIASYNAQKFLINQETSELIKSHMYPFWRKIIKTKKWKNFWVLKFADMFCAVYEIMYSVLFFSFKYKNKIKLKRNRTLLDFYEQNKIQEQYVLCNK